MGNYAVEGSNESPRVRANVRLVLDKVELMMTQFYNEKLLPELQGCLNAACEDVLKVERWKPQIEYQLRRGIEEMIKECIESSIKNNWEMRRQLTYLMSEEMKNSLAVYIEQIKPDLPTHKPEGT